MSSSDLEDFRSQLISATTAMVLQQDVADLSAKELLLYGAMVRMEDYLVDRKANVSTLSVLMQMNTSELDTWFADAVNQGTFAAMANDIAMMTTLAATPAVALRVLGNAQALATITSTFVAAQSFCASDAVMAGVAADSALYTAFISGAASAQVIVTSSIAFAALCKVAAARTTMVANTGFNTLLRANKAQLLTAIALDTDRWVTSNLTITNTGSSTAVMRCGANAAEGTDISAVIAATRYPFAGFVTITTAGYYQTSGSKTFVPRHLQSTGAAAGDNIATASNVIYTTPVDNNTLAIGGLYLSAMPATSGLGMTAWRAL
jgi:hypothetical protein